MSITSDNIREDLAAWQAAGGEPQDLPASAALFALDCHGCEANLIGTMQALLAVSDKCPECDGEGSHCDDSHPANQAMECERCYGHGRVPLAPERVALWGETQHGGPDAMLAVAIDPSSRMSSAPTGTLSEERTDRLTHHERNLYATKLR